MRRPRPWPRVGVGWRRRLYSCGRWAADLRVVVATSRPLPQRNYSTAPKHQQVLLRSAVRAEQRDALVEVEPAALVAHGQRQQIQVRDLVEALNPREVAAFVVAQRDIVRPEDRVELAAGLAHPFAHLLDGRFATAAVVG